MGSYDDDDTVLHCLFLFAGMVHRVSVFLGAAADGEKREFESMAFGTRSV